MHLETNQNCLQNTTIFRAPLVCPGSDEVVASTKQNIMS